MKNDFSTCNYIYALLLFFTCYNTSISAMQWNNTFDIYNHIIHDDNCKLIIRQYDAIILNTAPTIADPSVTIIPILECNEPLIDIKEIDNNRIIMLPDPDYPFASPLCNAGFACSSKIRISLLKKLERMVYYLDLYAPMFGYHSKQISIKVFEGLRDITTQKHLYEKKKNEIANAHPEYTKLQLNAETSKWVSPVKNNVPVHSTGSAIDLCLFDNTTQQIIDMGTFGVIWGNNNNAPCYSSNISEHQKTNRLYLQLAANAAGLVNYCFEWWHFSTGDKYAAYWQENNPKKRIAIYDSIN